MFAKGSRFTKPTASPTPGPADYNPQEPNFQAYKRGGFLEKSERFQDKEASPEPESAMNRVKPAPTSGHKPAPSVTSVDRYAILQRKVEELERVHQDGKKAHQNDMERLKMELAKHQKQHMDNIELIEKERRKNALLEARVRELKRSNGTEEGELKEARAKLRALESERNRLQLTTTEVQELKNSLQSLEAKRRDELKERDSRIIELEKALAEEKRARDALTAQCHQLKRTSESERRVATRRLQALVDQKTAESSQLQQKLAQLEAASTSREEELVSRLQEHKGLLSQVASEYGRLFSQTLHKSAYEELDDKYRSAQLQTLRLERKLSNSEAQVVELVNLIRHTQSDNALLFQQLSDALQEVAAIQQHRDTSNVDPVAEFDVSFAVQDLQSQLQTALVEQKTYKLIADLYRLYCNQLAVTSRLIHKELAITDVISEQHSAHISEVLASHEAIASRLETVSTEYSKSAEQVARAAADRECVDRDLRNLNMKLEERDALLAGIEAKHKQALKKERDTIQRLNSTLQKERMAEEALRGEIEKLSSDLQGLEWYEQAYENLNKQIALLVSRNKIAEEEAATLSQCNAEILGHHNPAQRILYVDRIRRELAEAKQQIAELNLEKERAEAQGSQLQQELEMYTSVMVPVGSKPRTNLTRVTRVPLSNVSESLNQSSLAPAAQPIGLKRSTNLYTSPSDMTIDELS